MLSHCIQFMKTTTASESRPPEEGEGVSPPTDLWLNRIKYATQQHNLRRKMLPIPFLSVTKRIWVKYSYLGAGGGSRGSGGSESTVDLGDSERVGRVGVDLEGC